MSRPLRIAFCRVAQETNALSPVQTELADFQRTHFLEGPDLLDACGRWGNEAPGMMRNAELSGFVRAARKIGGDRVELVPLFSAWTIPAGPLSVEAFDYFKQRLIDDFAAAGEVDGVFVSLHGAMRSPASDDPEAEFIEAIRGVVGAEVPIAASLDLHAHLTSRLVKVVTIMAAYRTNPHRDHAAVGYRAGAMLIRTVLGDVQPAQAWRTLPMVLGGGTTIDFLPTMRPIFRRMKEMEKDPRVLYVSLFMCHLWNDAPDLGWSTHVCTDDDPRLAGVLADELADLAWSVRHKLPPELPGPTEAIRQARGARIRRKLGTVCISDASDMVTAGATGENSRLLAALLEQGLGMLTLASIRDAPVVDALWNTPAGTPVTVHVGGKLDPIGTPGIDVAGRFIRRHSEGPFGRRILLDLGHVQLVVTADPPLAIMPSFYSSMGLRPFQADICVVKSLFPFRMYFLFHSRKTVYARTSGVTDFDAYLKLDFDGPVHPKDVVHEWRSTDRRRRAIGSA